MMTEIDKNILKARYSERYKQFGYSPKTLGWDKGKQDLRYHILFEEFNLAGKSILDIGCGFGDANKVIQHKTNRYQYLGIDIVEELIEEATKNYINDKNISFLLEDFLQTTINDPFDIVVASGVFNFKLKNNQNYQFIEAFMKKAFEIAKEGFAFDFLSDRVDYKYEHTFHSSPSEILNLAYPLSKNLILKNNYMPFEFALIVFKNSNFDIEDTIFERFKNERNYYRFH